MSSSASKDARLNFRLAPELKQTIEEAAAALGQSVSDYAVATLVQDARKVIAQRNVTELSNRDRDRLLALLDDAGAEPNADLKRAAASYKRHFGRKR